MKVIHEGRFYQIVDMGEDWRGYFLKRYHLEIKPDAGSGVMTTHASADDARVLMPSLLKADNFHAQQLEMLEAAC